MVEEVGDKVKFNIISINDDRAAYKEQIRANVAFDEIHVPAIEGAKVDIRKEIVDRGMPIVDWIYKTGEAGVWLSNFDCWKTVAEMDEPLIVFEDDAVVRPDFHDRLNNFCAEFPPDWDFASLWVPENQKQDYQYNVTYRPNGDILFQNGSLPYHLSHFRHSTHVAKIYQGYGMVAIMYNPSGGRKLIEIAQRTGMYTPVDCFVHQQAHATGNDLKGFAPTPFHSYIVDYDWKAQSHVQQTEKVEN